MEFVLFTLAAVLCLVGVGYCLIKPRFAFIAVLLMFPTEQLLQSYNPALILRYNWLVNVIAGLIVLFAVSSSFFRKSDMTRGMWNGVTLSLGALFLYVLAATAWTPALDSAQFFLKANVPYWGFFLVLSPILLRRVDDFARIVVPTMVVGIIVSTMIFFSRGHFQYGRFVVDLGYLIGYGQLESNPLALADLGGTIAIMATLYRGYQRSTPVNVIRIVAFCAGLALALASGSRGQVVFSIVCSLAFVPLLHDRRNWGQFLSLGVMAVMVLGLFFVLYQLLLDPSGASRWKGQEIGQGLEVRADMALHMLGVYVSEARAWIFGLGTSAFNYYYALRETPNWFPHNIFVEALTEYGLIGFALLVAACVSTLRWGRVLFEFYRDDIRMRSTTLTLFAITVFQMLLASKQGHMIAPPLVFTLMLVIVKFARTEVWEQSQSDVWIGGPADEGWEPGAPEGEDYQGAYEPQPY